MKNSSFFKNKKVLVTGGTGFIGSHLVISLAQEGARVCSLGRKDALLVTPKPAGDNITFFDVDLLAEKNLDSIFCDQDLVFHLAATFFPKDVSEQEDENSLMTKNVFEAAKKSGVQRVVLASSAGVYPSESSIYPIPEKLGTEGSAHSIYGASKRRCEKLAQEYAQRYGQTILIPRLFNIYGPGDISHRFIPAAIIEILSDSTSITIEGNEKQTRDFLYITDCIRGLQAIMENGKSAKPINICSGVETTLLEATKTIAKIVRKAIDIRTNQTGKVTQMRSVGDAHLAQKQLGFRAEVSLHEGLQRTIEWHTRERVKTRTNPFTNADKNGNIIKRRIGKM